MLKQISKEELIELALKLELELQDRNKKIVELGLTIEQLLEQLNLFRHEKFGNRSEKSKDLGVLMKLVPFLMKILQPFKK
jgi:hypothetical protein